MATGYIYGTGKSQIYIGGTTAAPRRVPEPPKMMYEETLNLGGLSNQYGACGVGDAYNFSIIKSTDCKPSEFQNYKNFVSKDSLHKRSGGCGFMSAGFIDNKECKAMYLHLKSMFPILWQSPIRFNTNSGNNFFFCIFDTGEKEVPSCYNDPEDDDFDEDHEPGFANGLDW